MGNPAAPNRDPTDRPPPRRRSTPMFVRCGLAILVVLGLSAAIIIEMRISRQRPIINEIERVGGLYGTQFDQNQGIHYDWLARLSDSLGLDRAVSDVVVVELNSPNVTDAGVEALAAIPKLEAIGLDDTNVSDQGAAELNRIRPMLKTDRRRHAAGAE